MQRVPRPRLGGKAFEAAQSTLTGIELMPRIKKRQLMVEEGDEGRTAAARFYSLAAACPHRQGHLPLHDLLSKICDTTPWAARSPPRAWSAATCRCARLGPRGGVGAPRSARAKTGGAPWGVATFVSSCLR